MAAAAARAAVAARMRMKKKERDKQVSTFTAANIDESKKQNLISMLYDNDFTRDISDFIQSGLRKADEVDETEDGDDQGGHEGNFTMPKICPPYLTRRHFTKLVVWFSGGHHAEHRCWMGAYITDELSGFVGGKSNRKVFAEPPTINTKLHDNAVDIVDSPIDKDASGESEQPSSNSIVKLVNEFVFINQMTVASESYSNIMVLSIIFAGILVGVMSYPSMMGNKVLAEMDNAVQIIFTIDCFLKIFQEGKAPLQYWLGPERSWNNFDFWLVFVCWIPMGGNVAFLRLLRLMRLLKLVGKIKQLQLIVMGLLRGLSSVTYILILMLLIFYLFAVLGTSTFRRNDPFHFGSIGVAMLSLFRMATCESWSNVMFINIFGCNSQYEAVLGWYTGKNGGNPFGPGNASQYLGEMNDIWETNSGEFPATTCWKPRRQPIISVCYFVLFLLLAAFVLLSLFIGAVCGGMADSLDEFKAREEKERDAMEAKLAKIAAIEKDGPDYLILQTLRNQFDLIDDDGSGILEPSELVVAMRNMGEHITIEVAEEMIAAVQSKRSHSLGFGFNEFVYIMTNGEIDIAQNSSDKNDEIGISKEVEEQNDLLRIAKEKREKAIKEKEFQIIRKIRVAFNIKDEDEAEESSKQGIWLRRYLKLAEKAQKFVEHTYFVNGLTLTILAAGALVGIQTELAVPGRVNRPHPTLDAFDNIILVIFTIDVVAKIVAEGASPLRYLRDPWNKFDFFIVFACYIFMIPAISSMGSLLAMLRLLRLLRVLKLVKALPQLRVIIEALISGMGSISFVTIILFMFFYLYANIGMMFFGINDPQHFGSLHISLISLFRVATLDGWSDVMYVNMYGCDRWANMYSYGRVSVGFESMAVQKRDHANCKNPVASGWIAVAYFISFVVLGAQVLLTLFIGIVATSMEEAKQSNSAESKRELRLYERAQSLGIKNNVQLDNYRALFDFLDVRGESKLKRTVFDLLVRLVVDSFSSDHAEEGKKRMSMRRGSLFQRRASQISTPKVATSIMGRPLTLVDIDQLFNILAIGDMENFLGPTVELPEFVIVMEVMRRAMLDKSVVPTIRSAFKDNLALPVEPVFHGSARTSRVPSASNIDIPSRSNSGRQSSSHFDDDNGRRNRSDSGPTESSKQAFSLIRRLSQKFDHAKDDVHQDDFGRIKNFSERSRHPLTSIMSCDDENDSIATVRNRDKIQSSRYSPRFDGSDPEHDASNSTALQKDVESLDLACSNAWEHVQRARLAIRPVLRLNADVSEAKEVVSRLQSELLALNAVGERLAELGGLISAAALVETDPPLTSVSAVPLAVANWASPASFDDPQLRSRRNSQMLSQIHEPIPSADKLIDIEGYAELF